MKSKSKPKHTQDTSAPMIRDYLGVAELLKVAFGPGAKLMASSRPSGLAGKLHASRTTKNAGELRTQQLMEAFLRDVDWMQLDDDIDALQDIYTIMSNRGGGEDSVEVLGRVIKLLEDLIDTGESCNLK